MYAYMYTDRHICVRHTGQTAKSEQLRNLGRVTQLKKEGGGEKSWQDMPDEWAGRIADNTFSCVAVFQAILLKKIKPMYNSSGRRQMAAAAEAVDVDTPSVERVEPAPESSDDEAIDRLSSSSDSGDESG